MEPIRYKPRPEPQPTQNVELMMDLAVRLINRPAGVTNVGVFSGIAGLGKSEAGRYVHQKFNAIKLDVKSRWNGTELVDAWLSELMIFGAKGTVARKVNQIIMALTDDPRLIMIDEADYLVKKSLIDVVRDVMDATTLPIILIGEQNIARKMAEFHRAYSRTLDWVQARDSNLSDARLYAKVYAPGTAIADELLQLVIEQAAGNARMISSSITTIHEMAVQHGLKHVGRAEWKNRTLLQVPSNYQALLEKRSNSR